jgi:hypothetical protein
MLNWLYRCPYRFITFMIYSLRSWRFCGSMILLCGGSLTRSRRAMAQLALWQLLPVYSPHFRNNGGASRVSRRFIWHKIRNSAAVLGLPALHVGGNFRNCVNFNAVCNM